MCNRFAGSCLHWSHVGSTLGLTLDSLTLHHWRRCTTLNCTTECRWQIEDRCTLWMIFCHISSKIWLPRSSSHLFFRVSRVVRLFIVKISYRPQIVCLEYVPPSRAESSRDIEGRRGKQSNCEATKFRICKYLKKCDFGILNFSSSTGRRMQIYCQDRGHLLTRFHYWTIH